MRRITLLGWLGLVFYWIVWISPALPASCTPAEKSSNAPPAPPSAEIRREYRKGPFSVRLTADKDTLGLAQSLIFTIEAETAQGFEMILPGFGEKLGDFGIRDYREEQPKLDREGKILARKVYTLDPFLSGDYTIAPMQVRFRKAREGGAGAGDDWSDGNAGDTEDHEITTEPITIRVTSLLEKDQKDLSIHPIKGPVGLPSDPIPLPYILLGLGTAILIAGGAFFIYRRRTRPGREIQAPLLPPHETAYRQLEEILALELLEKGELKLFFSRISDVLRGYIENRFGIHAPRRTTEEFLSDIARDAPFSPDHQGLLMQFLKDCDLVKFANHAPSQNDALGALASCKEFIGATTIPEIHAPGRED